MLTAHTFTVWLIPHMKTERRGSLERKSFLLGCFTWRKDVYITKVENKFDTLNRFVFILAMELSILIPEAFFSSYYCSLSIVFLFLPPFFCNHRKLKLISCSSYTFANLAFFLCSEINKKRLSMNLAKRLSKLSQPSISTSFQLHSCSASRRPSGNVVS